MVGLSPEQIGAITGQYRGTTQLGNQVLGNLINKKYKEDYIDLARTKELNDVEAAEATFKLNSFKALITAKKNAVDEVHKKVQQDKMVAEIKDLTEKQRMAVRKQMTVEERLEFDKAVHADNLANQIADNLRADKQLKISQDTEKRLDKKDTEGRGETPAEKLSREKEGSKAGSNALNTEKNMDQRRLEAQTFNNDAPENSPNMLIYTPDMVVPGFFNDQDEDVVRVKLPVMNGRQITLGDIRKTAQDNNMSMEAVYQRLLEMAEAK